jgi:hypothetical protein
MIRGDIYSSTSQWHLPFPSPLFSTGTPNQNPNLQLASHLPACSPNVPTGLLGEYLTENNIAFTVVKVFEGDKLPNASSYSAIVSLGGIMGAYEEAEYPWIADEKKWLKENTDKGVPILGICLGCQLLADGMFCSPESAASYIPIGYQPF